MEFDGWLVASLPMCSTLTTARHAPHSTPHAWQPIFSAPELACPRAPEAPDTWSHLSTAWWPGATPDTAHCPLDLVGRRPGRAGNGHAGPSNRGRQAHLSSHLVRQQEIERNCARDETRAMRKSTPPTGCKPETSSAHQSRRRQFTSGKQPIGIKLASTCRGIARHAAPRYSREWPSTCLAVGTCEGLKFSPEPCLPLLHGASTRIRRPIAARTRGVSNLPAPTLALMRMGAPCVPLPSVHVRTCVRRSVKWEGTVSAHVLERGVCVKHRHDGLCDPLSSTPRIGFGLIYRYTGAACAPCISHLA
ncbi:unnamed protein product [Cutaneotrichosporon oleaginosum]